MRSTTHANRKAEKHFPISIQAILQGPQLLLYLLSLGSVCFGVKVANLVHCGFHYGRELDSLVIFDFQAGISLLFGARGAFEVCGGHCRDFARIFIHSDLLLPSRSTPGVKRVSVDIEAERRDTERETRASWSFMELHGADGRAFVVRTDSAGGARICRRR